MEFKIYQNLVEKYYKNDCRELNFQNRILIPFLELLIEGNMMLLIQVRCIRIGKKYIEIHLQDNILQIF